MNRKHTIWQLTNITTRFRTGFISKPLCVCVMCTNLCASIYQQLKSQVALYWVYWAEETTRETDGLSQEIGYEYKRYLVFPTHLARSFVVLPSTSPHPHTSSYFVWKKNPQTKKKTLRQTNGSNEPKCERNKKFRWIEKNKENHHLTKCVENLCQKCKPKKWLLCVYVCVCRGRAFDATFRCITCNFIAP